MKFPDTGFIFKYILDELADLIAGIILLPVVVFAKVAFPLWKALK